MTTSSTTPRSPARCEQVVGALAGLGLERGDRVAVLAANCHRYVELYFGVPAAGLVLLPLNIRLAPPSWSTSSAAPGPGC